MQIEFEISGRNGRCGFVPIVTFIALDLKRFLEEWQSRWLAADCQSPLSSWFDRRHFVGCLARW